MNNPWSKMIVLNSAMKNLSGGSIMRNQKMFGLLMVFVMMLISLGGCATETKQEPTTNQSSEETGGDSNTETPAVETTSEDAGKAAADFPIDPNFNPEAYEDTIEYKDLEAEFGPVPEISGDITIGAVMNDLTNEYWSVLSEGIKAGAEKYGVNVDVQCVVDNNDEVGQLALAETMVNKGYDAFIFSPMTDELLAEPAAQARALGAPIVNTVANLQSNANVFVGNLHYNTGRCAGEYFVEKLGGKGKVALVMGAVGMQNNTGRCNGFKSALEGTDIEVVAELPAEWSSETAMELATDCLTANPDLDGFFCVNDNMALGVVEAVRAKGLLGEVMVTGIDGISAAYDSISKGEMTATVESYTSLVGEISVELTLRLLGGQDINRVVSTPLIMGDIDNYQEFYHPEN